MLGLAEQVDGDPVWVRVGVGDDQHFGGTGHHVDAHAAVDLALGGGDKGVAGTGHEVAGTGPGTAALRLNGPLPRGRAAAGGDHLLSVGDVPGGRPVVPARTGPDTAALRLNGRFPVAALQRAVATSITGTVLAARVGRAGRARRR